MHHRHLGAHALGWSIIHRSGLGKGIRLGGGLIEGTGLRRHFKAGGQRREVRVARLEGAAGIGRILGRQGRKAFLVVQGR